MAFYEATFALKPNLDAERREAILEQIKNFIAPEEVKAVDKIGMKRFAYEVEKIKEGFYLTLNFEIASSRIDSVREFLRSREEILRLMITRGKKPPPVEERREGGESG